MNYSIYGQEIITDRPDQTESSSTIQKGSLQIETGVLIGFSDTEDFSERQLLAPTTLFRYGITNGIEIRVLNQLESIKNLTDSKEVLGISDIEIGTKIQLLKKVDINTEIALVSHLIIPSGTEELSNNDLGTTNKLSISHKLNEKMSLGYNLGYDYFGKKNGNLTYSMALGVSINEKTGIYVEPYGEFVDFDNHLASFDMGITYLLNKNFQLDFSFGTGMNHTMNFIAAGLSVNINGSKDLITE
ncbi:MAG: transporter [Bacteroidia bacterium]|nr:transporter [Bacteroidia bacterium]